MIRTVTDIAPQKKRGDHRVNIYLDGEFWSGANKSIQLEIMVGDQLDKKRIAELEDKIASEDAFYWAANYLSRWPRTVNKFKEKAESRGYGEDVIQKVTDLCLEYKFLDDDLLAESLTAKGMNTGKSKRWLFNTMREKGYEPPLIEESMESYDENIAVKKAIRLMRNVPDEKKMNRLLNRGFSYSLIRENGIEPHQKSVRNEDLEEEAIYALAEKAWKRYNEVSNKSVSWLVRRHVPVSQAWEQLKLQESLHGKKR